MSIATTKIIVLYHAECSDGYGASWVARKKFGIKAAYIPVSHGVPPPRGLQGKEIYMIDFTYPRQELHGLIKKNVRVTAIDHHISAKANTLSTYKPLFSLDHSGSVLAWKYFFPKKKIPIFLRYIEDTDLWRFALPGSNALREAMRLYPMNTDSFNALYRVMENPKTRRALRAKGEMLLVYRDQFVQYGAAGAVKVRFAGHVVYAANTPILDSDIANLLYTRRPPFAIAWSVQPRGVKVSLRSDGSFDVAKLAMRYGGGGHKAASGFLIPHGAQLPWKIIK